MRGSLPYSDNFETLVPEGLCTMTEKNGLIDGLPRGLGGLLQGIYKMRSLRETNIYLLYILYKACKKNNSIIFACAFGEPFQLNSNNYSSTLRAWTPG